MISQNQVWETSKKFLEIENFLDLEKQKTLIKYFLHPSFPWALTIDAVEGIDEYLNLKENSIPGIFHTFFYNGQLCSERFEDIKWILPEFEKIGLDTKKIIRVRAGMFFKHPDKTPHICHVDAKVPHTTAVYYVNDCDGDLLLYNETFKTHPWKKPELPTEFARFSPAQGKLAIFDGQHYHASSYPTVKPLRLAITFNFLD